MKPANVLRYILLPALMFYAGTKAGVKYAKSVYVSKDRKFIKGEAVNKEQQ
jgi:hypothetical protein